jgi:hypothetical protein
VDYESLDRSEQEYAVKRLEVALKAYAGENTMSYFRQMGLPSRF